MGRGSESRSKSRTGMVLASRRGYMIGWLTQESGIPTHRAVDDKQIRSIMSEMNRNTRRLRLLDMVRLATHQSRIHGETTTPNVMFVIWSLDPKLSFFT